jgi:hypothetical protein
MTIARIVRYGISVLTAATTLAACSESLSPVEPVSQQAGTATARAGNDLLYVSGGCGGTCFQSYPKGKPAGTLDAGGGGICSNKRGDVFVPTATESGTAVVYEYAHGGTTPIETLSLSGLVAEGCAIDPSSGNLAVTYLCRNCSYGPVAVFTKASGSPEIHEQAGVYSSFCGYDGSGNLFVDGTIVSGGFSLLELPNGSNVLRPISLTQSISNAGQVQWDGTDLAIEDLSHPVIYQFKISGSSATRVGTTKLNGAGTWGGQSWINGGTVIVPFSSSGSDPDELGYWKYPRGGAATRIFKKHLGPGVLAGATISVAR